MTNEANDTQTDYALPDGWATKQVQTSYPVQSRSVAVTIERASDGKTLVGFGASLDLAVADATASVAAMEAGK